ncbi:MAG: universal stress protein [Saprospiraceae bacterium]
MKKILVPTDFSSCAENAMNFAIQSTKVFPVEVVLLHAFEINGNMYTDYMGVNREFNETLLNEEVERLETYKKNIAEKDSVDVTTFFFKGTFKDAIEQVKAEHDIRLIVMGTRGVGFLTEKLWGNKTAALISSSDIPVLAVPLEYTWKKPQKMLVSTNNFEEKSTILDFIFDLAALYVAQVYVAVFTDEEDDKTAIYIEHNRQLPAYEKMLREKYNEKTLVGVNLIGKQFEKTLQDYIDKNGIDILVMITYQRSFWDKLFQPSQTEKMSYHSTIPLLAIPAKEG